MEMYELLANMLGVPMEHEFLLAKDPNHTYMIFDDGVYTRTSKTPLHITSSKVLENAIKNKDKVIKYWKPRPGDRYFVPNFDHDFDTLYGYGLVCRTKKEASKLHDNIVDFAKKLRGLE